MRWTFQVDVEAEREEGLFASRDELGEQIQDALEGADPGTLEGGEGGMYSVVEFSVEETVVPRNRIQMWLTPGEAKKITAAREAKGGTA